MLVDKPSAALISVFTLSLLHTLIPSHWLCFVLVGRAQGWKLRRTLWVTAVVGFFHVATTIALGVVVSAVGPQVIPLKHFDRISAGILMAIGTMYLGLHLVRGGHHHEADRILPAKTAFLSLLLLLTLSPCEAVIPLFLLTASAGVKLVILLSIVLVLTTLGSMLILVWLSSLGVERLRFHFIDRYEKLIVGTILCTLGATTYLLD